ncbi:MAG: hypothetical protein Q7R52_03045 [archaeon]|nr:hypothetical protein [archaeon]
MAKTSQRIDGKCGVITSLSSKNKREVEIRLKNKRKVTITVALLKVTPKMYKMTADELSNQLQKDYHGRKKGDRVCISSEEPLYM